MSKTIVFISEIKQRLKNLPILFPFETIYDGCNVPARGYLIPSLMIPSLTSNCVYVRVVSSNTYTSNFLWSCALNVCLVLLLWLVTIHLYNQMSLTGIEIFYCLLYIKKHSPILLTQTKKSHFQIVSSVCEGKYSFVGCRVHSKEMMHLTNFGCVEKIYRLSPIFAPFIKFEHFDLLHLTFIFGA